MTYRGQVKNGVVVVEGDAPLPEGAQVQVQLVQEREAVRSLRTGLLKFAGALKGLPRDVAENHEHYVHGAPKRIRAARPSAKS